MSGIGDLLDFINILLSICMTIIHPIDSLVNREIELMRVWPS